MADKSNIEWTDATWNPIVGCSIVSPGCTNCYAMKMAARIEKMATSPMAAHVKVQTHYAGTTQRSKAGAVWTGKVALAPDHILTAPLRWKRGRKIFVNSMGDLFHESIPDEWIDRVFAVMALCPQHTFQVLTKRAERMREYFATTSQPNKECSRQTDIVANAFAINDQIGEVKGEYRFTDLDCLVELALPNVWLGVSCERQQEADERIPLLLQTPAAIRFISAEPLLGPILIAPWLRPLLQNQPGKIGPQIIEPSLDWVIVGGESGSNARPMHPQWARDIRDQCKAAGVAFFFKQWGDWEHWEETAPWNPDRGCAMTPDGRMYDDARIIRKAPVDRLFCLMQRVGKKAAGRLLDGVEHNSFPEARA